VSTDCHVLLLLLLLLSLPKDGKEPFGTGKVE